MMRIVAATSDGTEVAGGAASGAGSGGNGAHAGTGVGSELEGVAGA
jgi:hypothetical protein